MLDADHQASGLFPLGHGMIQFPPEGNRVGEDANTVIDGGEKNQMVIPQTAVCQKSLFCIASTESHGTPVIHTIAGRTVDVHFPIRAD
jgi:hypothetical protein